MELAGIQGLKGTVSVPGDKINFPPMHHVRIDCKRNDGNPQFSERRGLSCHDPLLSVYGH